MYTEELTVWLLPAPTSLQIIGRYKAMSYPKKLFRLKT